MENMTELERMEELLRITERDFDNERNDPMNDEDIMYYIRRIRTLEEKINVLKGEAG